MKWLMILAALSVVSCSSDPNCSSDSDCFQSEICASGQCTQGVRSDAGVTPDMGTTPDTSTLQDVSVADDGVTTPDMTVADMTPDVALQACEVDRLTSTCTDDTYEPNNSWIDGERLSAMYAGCPTTSTFVPLDLQIDATKCARDVEDWYYIDFYPCVNNDIEIVWTLTLDDQCSPDLFEFDSLSFDCGPEATCTKTTGAGEIRINVPQTGLRQSQLSYIALKKLAENFQANYSLRVQVIQK
ncbi:MAG: hypothetical protein R3E66_12615 [bacterium]